MAVGGGGFPGVLGRRAHAEGAPSSGRCEPRRRIDPGAAQDVRQRTSGPRPCGQSSPSRARQRGETDRMRSVAMSKLKMFGFAFALASGAFVLTMLKDPPKSVASDPTKLTIQPLDLKIQTGIPTGEYEAN